MTDQRVLALIGPRCTWRRLQSRDEYDCSHCGSRVTGPLIVALKQSLASRR